MLADMGGTFTYKPVDLVFKLPVRRGTARNIFIITDGAVTEKEDQTIEIIRTNCSSTNHRVITVGIGHDAGNNFIIRAS